MAKLATPVDDANEAFFDAQVRHQVFVLRFAAGLSRRAIAILNRSDRALSTLIRARLRGMRGVVTQADLRRMARTLDAITAERRVAWRDIRKLLVDELRDLGPEEQAAILAAMALVSPVQLDLDEVSRRELRDLATTQEVEGRTLDQWLVRQRDDDIARIRALVQGGLVAELGAGAISRSIVGTSAVRGADGITATSRRQLSDLVDSFGVSTSNNARMAVFAANVDIIAGLMWVATLDNRTCPVCGARDGRVDPMGNNPLPQGRRRLVPAGVRPPAHFNCRCVMVAIFDFGVLGTRPMKPTTQRSLLREFAAANGLTGMTSRASLPRGLKGQFDRFARRRTRELVGIVPATVTYEEFLRRQSAVFQNEALGGPTRGALFRRGDLSLDRFVSNGEIRNLDALSRSSAKAFRDAGLDPADFR